MGVPNGYTSAQVVQAVPTGINSALVYITRQTFSATPNWSITNVFSSTYKNYLIQVSDVYSTTNATSFGWRLGTSGSADTSSLYDYATDRMANGSAGGGQTTNADHFEAISSYLSDSSSYLSQVNIFLANPNTTLAATFVQQGIGVRNNILSINNQGGILTTATQYTDLFFFNNDGNNTNGVVTVYGLTNS